MIGTTHRFSALRTDLRVYLAVRRAGHSWWRALRCCRDVRRGSWSARDAGEMLAQTALLVKADDNESA